MKRYVIERKMSGTGTIFDIASQHFDRIIEFKKGTKYAVVLASFYGNGKLYTTHKTAKTAIRESQKNREYAHSIIDMDGNFYQIDGDELIPH